MHEGNLVICDQEQQYARNLLQMFARDREKTEVQLYLFHTIEEVEKFAEQKTVHTLLIGNEYPLGQREQIPAKERFVLVKSKQDLLAESEAAIYRYQSAEAIWSQMCNESVPEREERTHDKNTQNLKTDERKQYIWNPKEDERRQCARNSKEDERRQCARNLKEDERRQCARNSKEDERWQCVWNPKSDERRNPQIIKKGEKGMVNSETTRIGQDAWSGTEPVMRREILTRCQTEVKGSLIGIYSPIHRIGKTRFALEFGRELAKKEPVLYLNLEEYAGGDYYFPDQTGQTLADLLYYARQEKGNLGLRISTMVGQDEELDYIHPMPYVQDLQGVTGEEWLKLFEQILDNCIYQKVILDLGDSINGLFRILEACHTVYTPYIDDEAAHAKLNQYAENLRKTGREKVLEKTVQKKMKQR